MAKNHLIINLEGRLRVIVFVFVLLKICAEGGGGAIIVFCDIYRIKIFIKHIV